MTTLRLILGDQLYPLHPWFNEKSPSIRYVMMEMRQETDYVLHHAQKIIAIFAAMRDFAHQLRMAGHEVDYLAIDDVRNQQNLISNLAMLVQAHDAQLLLYQSPDEWRLDEQMARAGEQIGCEVVQVDSAHFYTQRDEVGQFFKQRKKWLMADFYQHMRRIHGVLLDEENKPIGGMWSHDKANRKAWSGSPVEPLDRRPIHNHDALWHTITVAGVRSFGEPQATAFRWPVNRAEALVQLDNFTKYSLPYFGDFQDAMSQNHARLFHSLLSFALNVKMITPQEVVERVALAYSAGVVSIASAEGYIRQILGWREYVRGVYWAKMPQYVEHNFFQHHADLPAWFWDGKTKMACLHHALTDSLQNAHAHHIQRLMVIGNFALLSGLSPVAVHQWYLGVYVDAFEWVELPNTLGMSQFADGGLLATKPYISSAAYIHRMSDYCGRCHYDKAQRHGDKACPYNALYWDFHIRHSTLLAHNPRVGMVYQHIKKMTEVEKQRITDGAQTLREKIGFL
ncbi:MAG: cryptochrome/photolyase family protein [Sulfuriferula sp.]|nr:cryptochrome/photolyase family protein [Sulfuriferula sp.]